ncbi:FAD/NAD(P)-binding domain-containing protein [Phlegmacium glaucopus]|nr:FAD/NAD(P)-binding domain-containing protein [Phlegmacium glaucopus]
MKIIIVGGGIGGLAVYHALRKHLTDTPGISIKVIESHDSPTRNSRSIGGGLGIAPNGLRAINSLSPEAVSYVQKHSFPVSSMTFRNAKGHLLGQLGVDPQRYNFPMLMARRAAIYEALLPGLRQEDVRWGLEVLGVRLQDDGAGVTVEYADGTTEVADLVIGADGMRSKVKDSLFKGQHPAAYDGLTGVGGFIELSALPADIQESFRTYGVTMTFGRKGFFGYSMCSPLPDKLPVAPSESATNSVPFIQWWSIYEVATPPSRKEGIAPEDIREQLLARHGGWKSPYDSDSGGLYKQIIELGCRSQPSTFDSDAPVPGRIEDPKLGFDTNVLVLPRYVTPRLPFWSNATSPVAETPPCGRGRIVLIGDAAHTMPPDSGQGASCALEDAVVYSLFLKHFLSIAGTSSSDPLGTPLERAAKAYEELRKPRVHQILDMAKRNGDAKKEIGWFLQTIRDLALSIICKLPQSINDKFFSYNAETAVAYFLARNANDHKES